MSARSVKTQRAPSRDCRDARVYGHRTTPICDNEYTSPLSFAHATPILSRDPDELRNFGYLILSVEALLVTCLWPWLFPPRRLRRRGRIVPRAGRIAGEGSFSFCDACGSGGARSHSSDARSRRRDSGVLNRRTDSGARSRGGDNGSLSRKSGSHAMSRRSGTGTLTRTSHNGDRSRRSGSGAPACQDGGGGGGDNGALSRRSGSHAISRRSGSGALSRTSHSGDRSRRSGSGAPACQDGGDGGDDNGSLSRSSGSHAMSRRSVSFSLTGTIHSGARSRRRGNGFPACQDKDGDGGGRRSESVRWADGTGGSGDGKGSGGPSPVYSGGGCLPDLRLGNGRQTCFFLCRYW